MLDDVKPDLAHLCAFGVPYAIVSLSEKLRKLDDQSSMCVLGTSMEEVAIGCGIQGGQ